MGASRFELSVGESIQIEDQILTVIDICGEEITFRIDFVDEPESDNVVCGENILKRFPPR